MKSEEFISFEQLSDFLMDGFRQELHIIEKGKNLLSERSVEKKTMFITTPLNKEEKYLIKMLEDE